MLFGQSGYLFKLIVGTMDDTVDAGSFCKICVYFFITQVNCNRELRVVIFELENKMGYLRR